MTQSKFNCKDARESLDDLHNSIVDSSEKLGIAKWGKQELPILVVNPLNLPKVWPVYQQWKNTVDKKEKYLVFWYGSGENHAKAFSFIRQNAIISLDKKYVAQRLNEVLAKPKNANIGALVRRSFEELKPDLDKSAEELRRKFDPENKRPAAQKRRPSPKADNRGKRRLRGPVVEKRVVKSIPPKEPCLPVRQSVRLALRKLSEDRENEEGCEQQAIAGEDQMQFQAKQISLDTIDAMEVEIVHQPQVVPSEGQTQPEPLEMATQPPIPTSEDPVDAEPGLHRKVIACGDQTRAQSKAPQNQKVNEEIKSKTAGKPQDSSRRGGDGRCIARIRRAQENGEYGPPEDIYLSGLKEKDGIQEYSIKMNRGGHLRFIGGMVSTEQCKDIAKEMESIEYRRYPLKGLNALEPRVHLLLSKAANPPAKKLKEKDSMDSHVDSQEAPDQVDVECQNECRVESLPETAKGYKYHSVKMQAHPISDFKAIERVDEHVADFFQTDFNIGVDALCYRNGKDYIGFHADDTQGEDIVVSLTVESLCQRVLRIKPKGKVCVGDEQIDLFPCAGDGYSMDGNMQCGYLHSLRKAGSGKKVAEARRFALIFRHGEVASVGKDTGKQVESLEPDPSGPVEYSFGAMECVQQGQEYTKSDLVASGAHKNFLGGVSGNQTVGCDAITVSRSSPKYREEDHLSWLRYSSNVHQGLHALYASWKKGEPVRVFRSSNLDNQFKASSSSKNHQSFRYDGLYKVTHVWNEKGEKDPLVLPKHKLPLEYTFLLERSCGDGNLTETNFFAECKHRESMPAFLEHNIDWTEQSKAPVTLSPIQPKAAPSSAPQVNTSEATALESVPPLLGEQTPLMVEESRQVETGMHEPAIPIKGGQGIMKRHQMMHQHRFYGCEMGYSPAPGYGGYSSGSLAGHGHPACNHDMTLSSQTASPMQTTMNKSALSARPAMAPPANNRMSPPMPAAAVDAVSTVRQVRISEPTTMVPIAPVPSLGGRTPPTVEEETISKVVTEMQKPATLSFIQPSKAVTSILDEELRNVMPRIPQFDERSLLLPEDKPLISDYLYLALEQMSPCVLMEADRVGYYKTRKVGFAGLACKHCVGQASCGRYFPASEASVSQTTTKAIMNHVRNCRRCPIEIREDLEIMKRALMGPDGKRADKPKHGGRKAFFHRLWCRVQGIPMEDGNSETKEKRKRGNKAAKEREKAAKKAKKQRGGGGHSDNGNVSEPDDKNETVASRNPLQCNSGFDQAKEDKSDEGSGADKENGAQVEATPTQLQDYSKEWNMVTPDGNEENEATNDGGIPQNDISARMDNLGLYGMDELPSLKEQHSAGPDKENGAQIEATSTHLQDYAKERSMVTPDGCKKNEATNSVGIPQNDKSAEIDNYIWDCTEWMSVDDSPPRLPTTLVGHRSPCQLHAPRKGP